MSSRIDIDEPGIRVLLMGNEAIARGAIEAGVQVATSYPGTPASEIMGALSRVAKKFGVYVEWSTNEMVAFEVAYAASLSGLRSMVSFKHLGFNWVLDPLLVSAYTGVNGGLVAVTADDPHPYSSQNAEDTRYYVRISKVPCLEPSDIQEAKDFLPIAFKLSEGLQLPVIVRVTNRISHTRGDVVLGPLNNERRSPVFKKDFKRYVMIAPYARQRHPWLNEQYRKAAELAEASPLNRLEVKEGAELGIIASGVAYLYVKEALKQLNITDKASVLKLSFTNPIPKKLIANFLRKVRKVLVVEEIEPIIENEVKAVAFDHGLNPKIYGRSTGHIPLEFELTPEKIMQAVADILSPMAMDLLNNDDVKKMLNPLAPPRTPFLCPGCPHRASYYAIKKALKKNRKEGIIVGDRGCYNQGVHPPLQAIDTCICMGASIAMACGFYHAGVEEPVIAVIGDSTFFHAGIPALINAVHNKANMTLVVLDNQWTAMTGHQPSPSTGMTATGEETKRLLIEDVANACGVDFVKVVDPYNVNEAVEALREAVNHNLPAVVICRHTCALQEERFLRRRGESRPPYKVNESLCVGCKVCVTEFGCPAMEWKGDDKAWIDPSKCVGCGVCSQICLRSAIGRGLFEEPLEAAAR